MQRPAHKSQTNESLRSSMALLGASFVWGLTFVAQSMAMRPLTPYLYNASRFLLGALVLFPLATIFGRQDPLGINYRGEQAEDPRRPLLLGGLLCGMILFAASAFQQVGIQYTTAGKSGFITALYIVLVPLFGLFVKRKCSPLVELFQPRPAWERPLAALGGLVAEQALARALAAPGGE